MNIFDIASSVAGVSGVAASALPLLTATESGGANVPAVIFTILNVALLVTNTAIQIYKKIKAAKREQDKLDKELETTVVEGHGENGTD